MENVGLLWNSISKGKRVLLEHYGKRGCKLGRALAIIGGLQ